MDALNQGTDEQCFEKPLEIATCADFSEESSSVDPLAMTGTSADIDIKIENPLFASDVSMNELLSFHKVKVEQDLSEAIEKSEEKKSDDLSDSQNDIRHEKVDEDQIHKVPVDHPDQGEMKEIASSSKEFPNHKQETHHKERKDSDGEPSNKKSKILAEDRRKSSRISVNKLLQPYTNYFKGLEGDFEELQPQRKKIFKSACVSTLEQLSAEQEGES